MSLILKQETSGNVPIPPAGKGTLFLTANNQIAVKDAAGSTSSFVTISSGGNTQILYNDDGSLGGNSSLTFNKTTSTMTVTNLSVTGNLNAGDISVSSIANGTSNVDIIGVSGNVTTSVAGVANVLVITTTGTNVTGTFSATGNANVGNLGAIGIVATTLDGSLITNAQPNITSVGTLTNLAITGNASAGNFDTGGKVIASTFESNVANGTAPIVVISTTKVTNLNADLLDGYDTATTATANTVVIRDSNGSFSANVITATLSGAATSATTAGTVTTAAQPNITSTGTLTSLTVTGTTTAGNLSTGGTLSVTGNANVGNLGTAGLITASGNVSGGNLTTGGLVSATGNIVSSANVVTDLIVGKTSGVTITAAGSNQNINLVPTGTGKVNVGNFIISNVASPVASTDAATKQYVDDVAQGLHTHDSCNAATQTTLASISGGTVTYNNGTSGVGATLTTTGTYTTIDGVTLSDGMRILVKDEVTTANNGIYVRTSSTVLTRADDFDTPTEMAGGDFTFVTAGTLYDNTGWVMPDPVTTVGTSPVVWVQFSGAGTYTAGTGLALNGSVFSIANTTVVAGAYGNGDYNATFTVNGQGQLSAAANVAITANAANLTGTTLTATIVNSSLTSVGTLTNLSVSNATGVVNFTTTANVTLGAVSNLHITGGTANYVLSTNGSGNLSWVAQSGDVMSTTSPATDGALTAFDGTTGKLIKSANLTANNVILGNGTSAVQVVAPGTTGNVLTSNGTTWTSAAPVQVYPAAGMAVSTGTAWGTSKTTPTGDVVGTSDTQTLTNKTISGADNTMTVDGTNAVGFRNIPQNSQSAAYTLVLADAGKHILHPSADANARTFTIPANSSVAYPIGTAVTFVNMTSQVVTIAITSDTLTLSPAGTSGSRSLAQYGSATAIKIGTTQWLISGSGLT